MADASRSSANKTTSRTVTDTVVGEHTHTIVGYSLIKGIGDGEPIASERFTVGGHEWVLLFYPDGKRSSSSEGHIPANTGAVAVEQNVHPVPHAAPAAAGLPAPPVVPPGAPNLLLPGVAPPNGEQQNDGHPAPAPGHAPAQPNHPIVHHHHHPPVIPQLGNIPRQQRRDTTNEYAALFVALIGEGPNPQGIVNTSEGKVVRAFHRFTLVDQTGQGRDLTKGRTRDAGAVKISCARQDPNARNCHGYRKFVKRSILEDPNKGFLLNDTIVIKYTIELVVSSGGALSRGGGMVPSKAELIKVPPPHLGTDLATLLNSESGADVTFVVEGEEMKVHKIILVARSEYFDKLLTSPMKEGQEGRVVINHIKPAIFRIMLHFVYTDSLPEELEGQNFTVEVAQHLLVVADEYQLIRLRRICERRLCETVDVDSVATTLTLAEQNHAEELKKVCLDFVSRNLQAVMATKGYETMTQRCPQLQEGILQTIAAGGGHNHERHVHNHAHRSHPVRVREHAEPTEDVRRVRPRRE